MGESERVPAALQGVYDEIVALTDEFWVSLHKRT